MLRDLVTRTELIGEIDAAQESTFTEWVGGRVLHCRGTEHGNELA